VSHMISSQGDQENVLFLITVVNLTVTKKLHATFKSNLRQMGRALSHGGDNWRIETA